MISTKHSLNLCKYAIKTEYVCDLGFDVMLNYIGIKPCQLTSKSDISFDTMLNYTGVKQSESKQKRAISFDTVLNYIGIKLEEVS